MLTVGWTVVAVAVLLSIEPGPGWAVGILTAGGAWLMLLLGATMPRPKRPVPLARPASVDIEARRIRAFQEIIDERENRGT